MLLENDNKRQGHHSFPKLELLFTFVQTFWIGSKQNVNGVRTRSAQITTASLRGLPPLSKDKSTSAPFHPAALLQTFVPSVMFGLPRTGGKQLRRDISFLSVSQFIFYWHFSARSKQIIQPAGYLWRGGV